jgi:hypothetical protein
MFDIRYGSKRGGVGMWDSLIARRADVWRFGLVCSYQPRVIKLVLCLNRIRGYNWTLCSS